MFLDGTPDSFIQQDARFVLHGRYAKLGKRLRLTNLSVRNRRLFQRADAGVVMLQEGN